MATDARIMIRHDGERWRLPKVDSYEDEAALQALLAESPDLIPGVERATAVREVNLPGSGVIDVIVVSSNGEITLVECKLASNAEVKRAVVGQLMSYAAATWRMSYEEFDDRFQSRAGESLVDAICQVANDGWDESTFRTTVSDALESGAFRLIVAVDSITDELKSIIEFLNLHTVSELEVLALELGYVADRGVEILLPRTHGEESARVKGGSKGPKVSWRIDDVLGWFAEHRPDEAPAVTKLYDWLLDAGGKVYCGSGSYPTMSGYLRIGGEPRAIWAVYADPSGPTAPRISLNFSSYRKQLSEDQLEVILTALEEQPSLAPHLQRVRELEFRVNPTIPTSTLAEPGIVDHVVSILDNHTSPL